MNMNAAPLSGKQRHTLTGVILAGGQNRRMGGTIKALLPISGEPFIQRQIRSMQQVCAEIIVVTNSPQPFLPLFDPSIRIISDTVPGKGPLGGMHGAFLAAAYAHCWVVGCDMPFLSPEAALLMLSRTAEHDAVVPVIKGKVHPLHGVYATRCADTIIAMLDAGNYRVTNLLNSIRMDQVNEALFVESGINPRFILNVNTPSEYEAAIQTSDLPNGFRRKAIQVAEAQRKIEAYLRLIETEHVALENAYGRRLAEHVIAPHSLPHFRRSGMDGYAIMSDATVGASPEHPIALEMIEHIPCGSVPTKQVTIETASKIMTGAMLPAGADAVIMLEMTESFQKADRTVITIQKQLKAGQNVTPIGFELAEGDPVLEKGTKIGAGETALLATFGYGTVSVYKRPRAAIFATGSELIDIHETLQAGKIRNSNSYMLAAQVREAGGIPLMLGAIPDDAGLAKKHILQAFSIADFVITTGGVSVGDHDVLAHIFADWDGITLFNKVMMRPGSPTTVGVWNDKFLFALSGNPGACFVGFELFVRPVIWGMQGKKNMYLPQMTAYLGADYPKVNGYERFVRGSSCVKDGRLFVEPAGFDQSSVTLSIKDSDCLIIIPPGGNGLFAGDLVSVLKLNGME